MNSFEKKIIIITSNIPIIIWRTFFGFLESLKYKFWTYFEFNYIISIKTNFISQYFLDELITFFSKLIFI